MKRVWIALMLVACGGKEPQPAAPPPVASAPPVPTPTPSVDRVGTRVVTQVDDYFGTKVSDPYRWLEDGQSPDTLRYSAQENARTESYLRGVSGLSALRRRVERALSIGYANPPTVAKGKRGRLYFHTQREGKSNQPTLYVRTGDKGKDKVLIDVSALSADGTSALDWWYPSWSGKLVAWGRSEAGSEDSVLHLRDVDTGADDAETIPHTRHASVAFLPDERAFFYTRYPEPGSVPAGDEKYGSRVFLHERGKPWKGDREVFGAQIDKTDVPQVSISQDGRWVLVRVHRGWDKSDLWLWDRKTHEEPTFSALTANVSGRSVYDASFAQGKLSAKSADTTVLFVQTNDGAPNYRLFMVDPAKAQDRDSWTLVLAEGEDALVDVAITPREIVATYLHNASSSLRRFDRKGKSLGEIALPGIGTAHVSASADGQDVFTSYASYASPTAGYRVQLGAKPSLSVWSQVSAVKPSSSPTPTPSEPLSAQDIVVEQRTATSKDGTKIPYFLVSKGGVGGLKRPTPTVLYGYGGFNIVQSPSFSPRALAVAESGGIWVTAILRGGGEFGERWHQAGMQDKKQNVFDDFFAVASALSGEGGVTDADHLAAMGGSNGGLLVAASIVQHPEAFRAAVSMVPLTDMLRYQDFRIAKLWIPEYGASTDAAQFKTLLAYSPYHNVKDDVRYPATLFTTAEEDSRVDPMHARKMAARLRAAQKDPSRPILLRVESKAGHGAGKPTHKVAAELASELGFLLHEMGSL